MTNPFQLDDTHADGRPNSELDIYQRLVESQASDDYLSRVNVGTGNYSDAEMWQQIQSYRDGLLGEAALSRRLVERAVIETKRAIALRGYQWWDPNRNEFREVDGWVDLDEADREQLDRRRWIHKHAEKKWQQLPAGSQSGISDVQLDALMEFSGLGESWTPPHWRMLEMRHEASRSRGARLIDNTFGRVREFLGGENEQAADALTTGRREGPR